MSSEIYLAFEEIEKQVSSGVLASALPDPTSFNKVLGLLGFGTRMSYFMHVANEINEKLKQDRFLKSISILNLGDIIDTFPMPPLPDGTTLTKNEVEEYRDYYSEYTKIALMSLVQRLNQTEISETELGMLKDFMVSFDRMNEESKMIVGEGLLSEEVFKYFKGNVNQILENTPIHAQPPKQIINISQFILFSQDKIESLNTAARFLEESGAIDSADKLIAAFRLGKWEKGGTAYWKWGVTECFYFLYKIYGSEYYNKERIDSISLKVFHFVPNKTRTQLSSNYKNFSNKIIDRNTFEDYAYKKQRRVSEILQKAGF